MVRGRPVPVRCVQTEKVYASVMAALADNGIPVCGVYNFNAQYGVPISKRRLIFEPIEPGDPEWPRRPRRRTTKHSDRLVVCVETGKVFPSGAAAARELGVSPNAIYQAIRKSYRSGGFRWRWAHG